MGPVLAAQFGYLPGTLWIIIGACLGGAVQDFVILFASMRRNQFNPERRFIDFDNPDAMHEADRLDGPPLFHFVEQPIELVLDHFLKRLVFEGADRRVLLRATHDAEKINRGAHTMRHRAL